MSRSNSRVSILHKPWVEALEERLPPGDALLGVLFGWLPANNPTPRLESSLEWSDPCILDYSSIVPVDSCPDAHLTAAETNRGASPSQETGALRVLSIENTSASPSMARLRHVSAAVSDGHATTVWASNTAASGLAGPRTASASSTMPRFVGLGDAVPQNPSIPDAESHVVDSEIAADFGKLPLSFEKNEGHTDSRVDFIARTGAYTVFLTPTEAVFAMESSGRAGGVNPLESGGRQGVDTPRSHGAVVRMQIIGGNPAAEAVGGEQLPGLVNYLIGSDPNEWHTNITTFGRVEYQDVYPGIDLAYYSKAGQMEYDFVVSPGADPDSISLNFEGADGMEIDAGGNLVLHTAAGEIVQQKPYLYQESDGKREEVSGNFVLDTHQSAIITFDVASYDPTRPLVIDPLVLGYSTYLGGSKSETGFGIAVDAHGNAYVAGNTSSSDFPTSPGAFDTSYNTDTDVFVSKLSADGSTLVYSTYVGGGNIDHLNGIAVDSNGNAYVTGFTTSGNYPTTLGAFDTTFSSQADAFVTKLSLDGSALAYSTFLGGSVTSLDSGGAIAVDTRGNAYVTGYTLSSTFPTTPGAFDTTPNGANDAFLAKLNTNGSALVYSTLLGGAGDDIGLGIGLDASGNAYVLGETLANNFPTTPGAFDTVHNGETDIFVTKFNASGSALAYSTYVGGSRRDIPYGMAIDAAGDVFVTGVTYSIDFPTTPAAVDTTFNGRHDAFVTKLDTSGSALAYSTFLGGAARDYGYGIAVDSSGNAYVTGSTESRNFPTTMGALDTTHNGFNDAFMTKLTATGSVLAYSTFLGGSSSDIGLAVAVDGDGSPYVTGITHSKDFTITAGAFEPRSPRLGNAFVTKLAEV